MSILHDHLPLRRWLLRGSSEPMAVQATRAALASAYAAMADAAWTPAQGLASDLPPHKYDQNSPTDLYDAYQYCGGYDGATAHQTIHCGAACYSLRLPAAAADIDPGDPADAGAYVLESIAATCYGDRWLAQGARIDVHIAASPEPPAWADIVAGTGCVATTGEPAAADDPDAPHPPPLRRIARDNDGADNTAEAAIPIPAASGASTGAARYLHVVLRLADYATVPQIVKNGLPVDSAWIEGGAALRAGSIAIEADRRLDLSAPYDQADGGAAAPLATLASLWTPGLIPHIGAAETNCVLAAWPQSTWRGTYKFCTMPRQSWRDHSLASRLNAAAERLRVPGSVRLASELWDLAYAGYVDYNAAVADFRSPSLSYGFDEVSVDPISSGTGVTVYAQRERAVVAYLAIEGDMGAAPVRAVRFLSPVAPVSCDAIVAAYVAEGRRALVCQHTGTADAPAVAYQALVPTAAAFADDRAHLGWASQMSVCGSDELPSISNAISIDRLYLDGSPANDTRSDNHPPLAVPLRPLFAARVRKGASQYTFELGAPYTPAGLGTLVVFVTPAIGEDSDFGTTAWNPSSVELH